VPVFDIIRAIKSAHPMDVLRTAASALSAFDPDTANNSREATLRKAMRLTSQVPMIVAAHSRIREGQEPVAPDQTVGHAANLLWMLTGKKPSADAAQLIDRDLILHAEHGSNASSFAARVVIGTKRTCMPAIVAAIAALSGPAHGGAAEDVMKMAEEIGDPSRAAAYVKERRGAGVPSPASGTASTARKIRARGICAPASSACRRKWASRNGSKSCRPSSRRWRLTRVTA
jgi:citrate synthase